MDRTNTAMPRISIRALTYFFELWNGRLFKGGLLSEGALTLLLQLYMKFTSKAYRDFVVYSSLFLSRARKGPETLFEIGRVREGERKIGYSLPKGSRH